jgi:hypothetical protein
MFPCRLSNKLILRFESSDNVRSRQHLSDKTKVRQRAVWHFDVLATTRRTNAFKSAALSDLHIYNIPTCQYDLSTCFKVKMIGYVITLPGCSHFLIGYWSAERNWYYPFWYPCRKQYALWRYANGSMLRSGDVILRWRDQRNLIST